jgi:tRNA modification GTPase
VISSSDTIFAAASGHGRSGICVIRVSGPGTRAALEAMAGGVPAPRRLTLRTLSHAISAEPLDRALVAWMPGPESFTGEDQAELHIHGGLAVRSAVLGALAALEGFRPAEPGEFTRRAFLNGRMELSEVEGLADLIDAETEAQRRQALRQLQGSLGHLVEDWRERLIDILASLEACLDFSDEGDVAVGLERRIMVDLEHLAAELGHNLGDQGRGERLRDGFVVVLAGPVNAGKSTLLNALAKRQIAIVAATPGTTRDAIEVHCDLEGLPVTFIDTAGLRETEDEVEQQGIARAKARVGAADLVLWLQGPGQQAVGEHVNGAPALRVRTKADLGALPRIGEGDLVISAKTGFGMDQLLARVLALAEEGMGQGDAVITRERHRAALQRAAASLARGSAALGSGSVELGAEDVRLALRALGEITGRVDVEQVLDRIFASFCIGK